jgi:hypothetical protein
MLEQYFHGTITIKEMKARGLSWVMLRRSNPEEQAAYEKWISFQIESSSRDQEETMINDVADEENGEVEEATYDETYDVSEEVRRRRHHWELDDATLNQYVPEPIVQFLLMSLQPVDSPQI